MKNRQITIKDIAKELGISPSTVSRALKDHPDISPKTKQKVKQLAERMQYRPNAIALSLKNSRSNTIGVLIPEIVHHFFSSVISGISDVAYGSGYNVMIMQSNESYDREVSDVNALIASRVDGVIVSMSKETHNFDHLANLENNGIPIVFFDRDCQSIDTDKVVVDDIMGAYQATEHLIEQGCKRIAHLAAPEHLLIGKNRIEGYKRALQKNNLPVDNDLILKCDTYEESLQMAEKLMKMPNPPDGIFAANDSVAIGAMKVAKQFGNKVPDDVAIIGFTNGLIASMTDPTLSTVEQHGFEMGQISARILLNRLKSNSEFYTPETRVLKTELVIRESSLRKKF